MFLSVPKFFLYKPYLDYSDLGRGAHRQFLSVQPYDLGVYIIVIHRCTLKYTASYESPVIYFSGTWYVREKL